MKSARHMLRRLAAASCAAAMCLLPMTGAKAATPYTGTSVSDIQYAKENSYIRYRQQYAAASRPDTIVEIEATSSYTASADAAVRTDTLDGRHALIWDSESGTVEWNFTVAEEGMYQFACDYYALPGKGGALEFELLLDGDYPFEEMQKIVLSRLWKDVNSPPLQDNQGNDIRSSMVEIFQWQTCSLVDTEGFINGAFCFYLTAGTHTLQLVSSKEPVAFSAFRFFNPKAVPSYEDYRAAQPEAPVIEGDVLRFEAELTSTKTSSMLYPFADRSDPLTSPSDPVKKRLNVIGGENWNTPDQVLTWEFTVPETGYYQLAFRYTQSYLRGFFVTREVAIDGAVPFTECGDVRFPYTVGNAVKVVGDDSPCLIYLEAGITHTLSMTPRIGALESLLSDVNYAVYQLNDAYRRIIIVIFKGRMKKYILHRYRRNIPYRYIPYNAAVIAPAVHRPEYGVNIQQRYLQSILSFMHQIADIISILHIWLHTGQRMSIQSNRRLFGMRAVNRTSGQKDRTGRILPARGRQFKQGRLPFRADCSHRILYKIDLNPCFSLICTAVNGIAGLIGLQTGSSFFAGRQQYVVLSQLRVLQHDNAGIPDAAAPPQIAGIGYVRLIFRGQYGFPRYTAR